MIKLISTHIVDTNPHWNIRGIPSNAVTQRRSYDLFANLFKSFYLFSYRLIWLRTDGHPPSALQQDRDGKYVTRILMMIMLHSQIHLRRRPPACIDVKMWDRTSQKKRLPLSISPTWLLLFNPSPLLSSLPHPWCGMIWCDMAQHSTRCGCMRDVKHTMQISSSSPPSFPRQWRSPTRRESLCIVRRSNPVSPLRLLSCPVHIWVGLTTWRWNFIRVSHIPQRMMLLDKMYLPIIWLAYK